MSINLNNGFNPQLRPSKERIKLDKKNQKHWVGVFLCFFLLFGFFFLKKNTPLPNSFVGESPSKILSVMPDSDRDSLSYFFQELIIWGNFGYVLFGEKPMALDVIENEVNPFADLIQFKLYISPRRIKFVNGFKTWKKYEKFFPTFRFVFLYEKDNRNNNQIILINKAAFIQQVENHIEDFEVVLNRSISGEELLNEGLCKPLIAEVLKNHDGLIGIVLGYGRNNSFLFHQRSQLSSEEDMKIFCDKHQFKSAWTDEEFEDYRKKFESISWVSSHITGSHMGNMELIALPGFGAVFHSSETQLLRQNYLNTRQFIIDHYKGKDFLETTLNALTL